MPTNNNQLVSIGADPEFAFSKEGRAVRADSLLRGGTSARFGTDGAPNTAELRPKPATSAKGLVNNIRKLIAAQVRRQPELLGYDWNAEPSFADQPLGGHIHFGFAPDPLFTLILDVLLAFPYAMIERASSAKQRKRMYGRLSDVRPQPWGMEYRSLSTWLLNEDRALAVLATAHALGTLWVNDRAALVELYEKAGGELTVAERTAYQKHQKSGMKARYLKVRDALKQLRNPALTKDHLAGIHRFRVMASRAGWYGVASVAQETFVNWKINGAKMRADAETRDAARMEEQKAERAAAAARRRELAALRLESSTVAWSSPLVAAGVPVGGLSYVESDDMLGEICGPMRRGAPWAVQAVDTNVRVIGLRQDRPCQVRITVASEALRTKAENIGDWLAAHNVSVEIVAGLSISGSSEVGLRRDLRNDVQMCRKVVTVIAMALNGVGEVA